MLYCMRTGSCADKPDYLECRKWHKFLIVQVEQQCILACIVVLEASCVCVRTKHDKLGSVSGVKEVSRRLDLITASYKHA